jgi:hypothetical protein
MRYGDAKIEPDCAAEHKVLCLLSIRFYVRSIIRHCEKSKMAKALATARSERKEAHPRPLLTAQGANGYVFDRPTLIEFHCHVPVPCRRFMRTTYEYRFGGRFVYSQND